MKLWPLLIVVLVLFSGCITGNTSKNNCEEAIAELPEIIRENSEGARLFEVANVLDGDTIDLINGEKVRFLEINAPEKGLKWSEEATIYVVEKTDNGVYLQKSIEDEDKYGRWLRYVFTNTSFVNADLVRQGFAATYPVSPNNDYDFLLSCLENEAKENRRGMWSTMNSYELELYVNLKQEFVMITNLGSDILNLQGWSIKDEATHFYYFKNKSIAPGESIILHTSSGDDAEKEVYWSSKTNVWNDAGDTAFLFNENGDLVASASFP